MARVSFSAMVYEIVGKLGGSVFQYSYGGYQVHVRNSPRNPQTQYQQLRRGDFGFLSASWRNLTTVQRQTFIDAATSPSAAFNLFVSSNVNLILIEEPIIDTYTPTTTPIVMPVDVVDLSPGTFQIAASTGTTVVPAGSSLLIYSTNLKAPTKIFTNPSQYSPIKVFPAGTDISAPVSIKTEFNSRFGQITADQRLCIKSVLIDTTNGSRGVESFNCTISEDMPFYKNYFVGRLSQVGTAAPTIDFAKSNVSITPTMTRIGVGSYEMQFGSDFLAGKTIVNMQGGNTDGPTIGAECITNGKIQFFSTATGSPIDNWARASIQIFELP